MFARFIAKKKHWTVLSHDIRKFYVGHASKPQQLAIVTAFHKTPQLIWSLNFLGIVGNFFQLVSKPTTLPAHNCSKTVKQQIRQRCYIRVPRWGHYWFMLATKNVNIMWGYPTLFNIYFTPLIRQDTFPPFIMGHAGRRNLGQTVAYIVKYFVCLKWIPTNDNQVFEVLTKQMRNSESTYKKNTAMGHSGNMQRLP